MLVELQDRDGGFEAISLMSVVGIRLEDKIDDADTVEISVYFGAIINPGAPGGYVHPSAVLGEYNDYDDALKVYEALMRLNWMFPGKVQIPSEDEDIEVALKHWKKYYLTEF